MMRIGATALLCLALLSAPAERPTTITVSAAASLTDALEAIAEAYTASGGAPVRFNFAGSNVLARQIVSGAPVDLFVSADPAQMNVAAASGAIDESTRIDLLANRLAVVIRPGTRVPDARALAGKDVGRIAVGDPAAVPSGVYARQFLESAGLWDALEPKLVPVGNVRAALAAVENGSADAAVVFESDAAISQQVALAFVVSGPHAPTIAYPAAVVRRSANRAAAVRFLAFLRSPAASAIFERYKFTPLTASIR